MPDDRDRADVRTFFDGWDLYRRIIARDYMYHRGIHAALRARLEALPPYRLLDLGCGDASLTAATLEGGAVSQYTGVDISPVALQEAAAHLADHAVPHRLVEADFSAYLAEAPADAAEVVLCGYAAHHLDSGAALDRFMKGVRRVLAPDGLFLLFDVFSEAGESRTEHLERTQRWREAAWAGLSAEELATIRDHVFAFDHPRPEPDLCRAAARAGFTRQPERLFVSPVGLHRLLAFS